jgi:hypothetical protein
MTYLGNLKYAGFMYIALSTDNADFAEMYRVYARKKTRTPTSNPGLFLPALNSHIQRSERVCY